MDLRRKKDLVKKAITAVIFTFVMLTAQGSTSFSEAAGSGDLTVIFEDIRTEKGQIVLALCSDKDIFRTEKIQPVIGRTRVILKDIPYGKYAIKSYHDVNLNNKLDKGLFGIPREPFGFSNNPEIRRKMPSYEESAFTFEPGSGDVTIRMR